MLEVRGFTPLFEFMVALVFTAVLAAAAVLIGFGIAWEVCSLVAGRG